MERQTAAQRAAVCSSDECVCREAATHLSIPDP
jgi:hypothetical protein